MPITRQFTATERKRLEDVASALADALLAGPWLVDAMIDRARQTVGDARWINELARAAHLGYPSPPVDRPRELTRFLMIGPPLPQVFAAALDNDRSIPVVYHRVAVAPARMVGRGLTLPTWNTTVDLANYLGLTIGELDWFADTQSREIRVGDERLRHYRYRLLAKRHGGFRLLESPKWQLRELQRRILHEVLDHIPIHDAVHGFRRGRSPISHVQSHLRAGCVIRVDLTNFFARLSAGRVWGLFRLAGYPEQVAYALTGLLTNSVPARVRRQCDPRLARWLAVPHLPQGAPTSPALANLAAYRLDRRLAGLAERNAVNYSRYADDLAFSGGRDLLRRAGGFVALVRRIAEAEGFAVNPAKTAVLGRHNRQQLTGIVVNDRPNVPRNEFDRLKATLHNCRAHGPAGQNRAGHDDFRAHLAGRIAWVAAVNPERGARLRTMFDRIDFGEVKPPATLDTFQPSA